MKNTILYFYSGVCLQVYRPPVVTTTKDPYLPTPPQVSIEIQVGKPPVYRVKRSS